MHSFIKTSVLALALIAAGCANVPEQIEVANETNLASFESVVNGDGTSQGATARWGGEIINVENKKDYSEIEVLHYPSNNYGKPRSTQNSKGRFKVRVAEFIDPLVFEKGRLITFLGEIGAPADGIIGEQIYVYPVLVATGYHMWTDTEEYEVSGFYYSPLSPYWGFGLGHRYWGSYGFYHDRARIRVKTKNSSSKRLKSGSSVEAVKPSQAQREISPQVERSVRQKGDEQRP
jgi:outer membrane lipoprotein